MFDVGDFVVFGSDGVCRVEAVGSLDIDGVSKDKIYYTLIPMGKAGNGRIFAPVEGRKVTVRRVMNIDEANTLISELAIIGRLQVEDDRKREERYKQVIQHCDLREVVQLMKEINSRKEMRDRIGKKLTAIDERYFGIAENCLCSELSLPLKMEKHEVWEYISSRM